MRKSWFCLVISVFGLAGSPCDLIGQEELHPRDWMVTRKQYRQPEQVHSFVLSQRKRLVLTAAETIVSQGDILQLLCGVSHISHAEPLVNPFTTTTFPRNLALVIYDAKGEFVTSLPSDDQRPDDADDGHPVSLQHYEMRGKWIEVRIGTERTATSDFTLPLLPGDYQIQMIACERFFIGRSVERVQKNPNESLANESLGINPRYEAARSNSVRFRVTNTPPSPPVADPDPDESPKLLARLDFQAYPDFLPVQHRTKGAVELCVCTLTNQSYSKSIGLIDPFYGDSKPMRLPVRWTRRVRGLNFSNGGIAYNRWNWKPQRSDFVILPPRGVVSNYCGGISDRQGNDEVRVDLLKGIVIDEAKLEVLRSGDPTEGWNIGGVSPDVIDPNSVLQRNFTYAKE